MPRTREIGAAIIHPDTVSILENALVKAAASFPRCIRAKNDFPPGWAMKLQMHSTIHRLNQEIVDQQFEA